MSFVVYSLLRLALVALCWLALVWAGLHPFAAVVAAALLAWGLSYVALRGPRDAAARWIARKDAERKARLGRPALSARAQADADAEDALIDEPGPPRPAAADEPPAPASPDGGPQSARPSPSSTP